MEGGWNFLLRSQHSWLTKATLSEMFTAWLEVVCKGKKRQTLSMIESTFFFPQEDLRHCNWREWQYIPVFLPGELHGQRSLAGYSSWGRRVGHDWATSRQTDRNHLKFLFILLSNLKMSSWFSFMSSISFLRFSTSLLRLTIFFQARLLTACQSTFLMAALKLL